MSLPYPEGGVAQGLHVLSNHAIIEAMEMHPDPMAPELAGKDKCLREDLRRRCGVVVAFSGGLDSTLLVAVAVEVLGDRALAVTARSPLYPEHEQLEAVRLAARIGVRHCIIDSNELDVPGFADNPPDRCYRCKRELFTCVRAVALREGLPCIADGTNADDLADYRPGRRAAQELGVISPLLDAGLGKSDIRALSRALRLPTADKPAFACLASRFPYGTRISEDALRAVSAVETTLRARGFRQFRARHHGDTVRIEIETADMARMLAATTRQAVLSAAHAVGFSYVTLDLEGYRTGSLNTPAIVGAKERRAAS